MSQSTARQRRRTWHQAKFSNHWAPAERHPWLWGKVSHKGKDLLLKAGQEGLCGQPGGKSRALCEGRGGSGCRFSSKLCWGEGLAGDGMTLAGLGGLEVTRCKPRWFTSGLPGRSCPDGGCAREDNRCPLCAASYPAPLPLARFQREAN